MAGLKMDLATYRRINALYHRYLDFVGFYDYAGLSVEEKIESKRTFVYDVAGGYINEQNQFVEYLNGETEYMDEQEQADAMVLLADMRKESRIARLIGQG